jgi:hypothetical protein
VLAAVTALALLATIGYSSQVGETAEASRVREVNSAVLEALGYAPQDTMVRGVGCRFIGRFGEHQVGARVRGAGPVTVSVRATALGTGR